MIEREIVTGLMNHLETFEVSLHMLTNTTKILMKKLSWYFIRSLIANAYFASTKSLFLVFEESIVNVVKIKPNQTLERWDI